MHSGTVRSARGIPGPCARSVPDTALRGRRGIPGPSFTNPRVITDSFTCPHTLAQNEAHRPAQYAMMAVIRQLNTRRRLPYGSPVCNAGRHTPAQYAMPAAIR
eukprot:2298443-Rhodomonas_salina.2